VIALLTERGAGWQDIFETEDKVEAEALARECGTETIVWGEDGSMRLTTVQFDGIVTDQRTNKMTWFNAICLLHPAVHKGKNTPWDVVYGDFSTLEESDVLGAVKIMQSLVRIASSFLLLYSDHTIRGSRPSGSKVT
jgi:hypothetical protein